MWSLQCVASTQQRQGWPRGDGWEDSRGRRAFGFLLQSIQAENGCRSLFSAWTSCISKILEKSECDRCLWAAWCLQGGRRHVWTWDGTARWQWLVGFCEKEDWLFDQQWMHSTRTGGEVQQWTWGDSSLAGNNFSAENWTDAKQAWPKVEQCGSSGDAGSDKWDSFTRFAWCLQCGKEGGEVCHPWKVRTCWDAVLSPCAWEVMAQAHSTDWGKGKAMWEIPWWFGTSNSSWVAKTNQARPPNWQHEFWTYKWGGWCGPHLGTGWLGNIFRWDFWQSTERKIGACSTGRRDWVCPALQSLGRSSSTTSLGQNGQSTYQFKVDWCQQRRWSPSTIQKSPGHTRGEEFKHWGNFCRDTTVGIGADAFEFAENRSPERCSRSWTQSHVHWHSKSSLDSSHFSWSLCFSPEEAGLPEGTCGRLLKAMYGCRDAAACWELEVTDMFTSCGFAPGLGSPVLFVNQTRDLKVSIHGDDITVLGFHDDLVWLRKKLEERYELKFGGLLGPEQTDVQNVALLNRLIHFGADCTTIEADPRHVKIVLNELGLNNAKTVSSPGVTCKDGDDTPLSLEDCKRFRSLTMRCNYLALDRPDINYSAKELARRMQNPTKSSWNGLKRLARYLAGCPRLIWKYEQQDEQFGLRIHTDSDDAGCTESRKSTSCGALYHGKHLLKFYSSTQHVISLSSGESEFYAGIKAGSTLLGALATMMDLGCQLSGTLVFDATAAKAMMNRRGHGKAKHISRCYLWLQQRVHDGELQLEKIGTKINTADLGTKHLDGSRIRELIEGMNLAFSDGKHSLALDAWCEHNRRSWCAQGGLCRFHRFHSSGVSLITCPRSRVKTGVKAAPFVHATWCCIQFRTPCHVHPLPSSKLT